MGRRNHKNDVFEVSQNFNNSSTFNKMTQKINGTQRLQKQSFTLEQKSYHRMSLASSSPHSRYWLIPTLLVFGDYLKTKAVSSGFFLFILIYFFLSEKIVSMKR
jgi:hypothetical protein